MVTILNGVCRRHIGSLQRGWAVDRRLMGLAGLPPASRWGWQRRTLALWVVVTIRQGSERWQGENAQLEP